MGAKGGGNRNRFVGRGGDKALFSEERQVSEEVRAIQ